MLNQIQFEIKKLIRRKKLVYLMMIITLFHLVFYLYNASNKDDVVERLYESTESIHLQVSEIDRDLNERHSKKQLNEPDVVHYKMIKEMKSALQNWRSAIYLEEFDQVPRYEQEFLNHTQAFLNAGGELTALDGINLEYAIQKNTWMVDHELAIEDERYPLSPHLFLNNSLKSLFGVLGIIILYLIFGNILSTEKEEQTWLILKTQPITKSTIILAKYFTLTLVLLFYLFYSIFIGVLIPLILSDHPLMLSYPQILMRGNEIIAISTLHDLFYKVLLFIGAGLTLFAFLLLLSVLFKKTLSTFLTSSFILISGYYVTDMIPTLQHPLNVFQLLRLEQIILEMENPIVWQYPIYAILWSTIFIISTKFLPERNEGLIEFKTDRKSFNSGKTSPSKGKLWHIVIFEWRKLLRKGSIIQALIILFLLFGFGYLFLHHTEETKEFEYFEGLNQEINRTKNILLPMYEVDISNYMVELKNTDDESQREVLQVYIDGSRAFIQLYQKRIDTITDGIEGYQIGNWEPFYDQQLFYVKLVNGDFDEQLHFIDHNFGQQFQYEVSIEEKKWLKEKEISPLFPGNFRLTIHDEYPDNPQGEINRQNWKEKNYKINASGLYSVFHFFEQYIFIVLLLLCLFLFGAGMSSEQGKKKTLYFLQTQPIARKSLFLGKTIFASLGTIVSILGIVSFIILLGTIFNRFGDWHYPILHYDTLGESASANYTGIITDFHNYGFHFIPLGNYLIECLFLLVLITFFTIVLANFLSLFIQNQFAVMFISIIILLFGHFVSVEYLSEFSYLSPFTYFDIIKVSNGEMATLLNQSLINSYMGYLILLLATLLLVLLGYLKESKK